MLNFSIILHELKNSFWHIHWITSHSANLICMFELGKLEWESHKENIFKLWYRNKTGTDYSVWGGILISPHIIVTFNHIIIINIKTLQDVIIQPLKFGLYRGIFCVYWILPRIYCSRTFLSSSSDRKAHNTPTHPAEAIRVAS